jgi:hypothetical protein
VSGKPRPAPPQGTRPGPAPEQVTRDVSGAIVRGPCLPCGCPPDSGCDGWHALQDYC